MKNTYIPLSIAYVSAHGVVNEILDMKPLDESITYPSAKPAKYAIEVAQGWFARNGIRPGDRVVIDGCLRQ